MKRNRFIFIIIFIIILLIIIIFPRIISKKSKALKKETQISSSSFSSKTITEEKPFGEAINIRGKKAVIVRKNKEDVIADKKIIYPQSLIVVEDTDLIVSNKNSTIIIDPGSKVYIGKETVTLTTGETKIEGKINVAVFGHRIYGNGEIVIKIKEDEAHIAQLKGISQIKNFTNIIELKEEEGIILYKNNNFEPPFKLPKPPEEIKVKIY